MTLQDVFRHIATLDGDPGPAIGELIASGDPAPAAAAQGALERYLDAEDWYGRDLMAQIVAGIRGAAAFPLLLRAFARPIPADHRRLLPALLTELMRDQPAACRPTVLSFVGDRHPDLRAAGLWALGHLVQPEDLHLLRTACADPNPAIRLAALGTATSLKEEPAAYGLVAAALRDPHPDVRQAAALHLRWFADPAALDGLAALREDPAARVRAAAASTIARLPYPGPGRRRVATGHLLDLVTDPEPQVRAATAEGLAHLATSDVAGALAVLAGDDSPTVRARLAAALGGSAWPGAPGLLGALAEDPDGTVRARATVARNRLRSPPG